MAESLYKSKILTIHRVASGSYKLPTQILAIALFTHTTLLLAPVCKTIQLANNNNNNNNNNNTIPISNQSSLHWYVSILLDGLKELSYFEGETFIGVQDLSRQHFQVGQEFYLNTIVSSSTIWKVALENVPSFVSKNRKGVIFIVKSKTGRHVSTYSHHACDSEVCFLPNTKFRVHQWYHGDVICLGQENIREKSFAVKERDTERLDLNAMIYNDKSLIIEIHEIL